MSQGHRIMIVDDDQEDIDLIQYSLEGTPYFLETFTDPEKALTNAQDKQYDLVITCFLMPLMDGIELVRAIKKTKPGIQSIILSGFEHLDTVLKAIRAEEISRYMTKPWGDEVLKRTIKALLKNDKLLEKQPLTSENPFLSDQVHHGPTFRTDEAGDIEKLEKKYPGITLGVWKAGQLF